MWKGCIAAAVALGLASVAGAAERRPAPVTLQQVLPEDDGLRDVDATAVEVAKKWQKGAPVTVGANGTIKFVYGPRQPTVVCAVLQVCDIQLQAGEVVNDVHSGDIERWNIEAAFSGVGGAETTHILVKPTENNLKSSLVVTTTRRVYHISLVSHSTDYMPRVAFSYPEDTMAKLKAQREKFDQERKANTIPETGEYLSNLDFAYRVTGAAPWVPVRVFNDSKKTIIQMPASMGQTEAPVLLILRHEGGLFSDEELVLMNYRLSGDRFIVDGLFDRAVLIAGVGANQDRVTIERERAK